jgi:cytochrome c peroxidase
MGFGVTAGVKSREARCAPDPLLWPRLFVVGLATFASINGLSGCKRSVSNTPVGPAIEIHAPLGLPPVPIPADNPPTADTIALGRMLFYDKRLSRDNSIACSSCHKPELDFSDHVPVALGVSGKVGVRNAPTIENAAYLPFQFWDGRASSLELQAASPISNPTEMDQPHEVSVAKLAKVPGYAEMFRKAFGTSDVTIERVEKAIASFERTVLVGDSAFDRYQYGGLKTALTPDQVRGLEVFKDPHRGNCAACHSIGPDSALFTDGKFHNTGEGVSEDGIITDMGRYHETKVQTDTGAFMTPTLRNIANTAPYMHDGKLKTLQDVVDFYAGEGNSNPFLDREMKSIALTGQDRRDLVEFMKSLSGSLPPNVGPPENGAGSTSK